MDDVDDLSLGAEEDTEEPDAPPASGADLPDWATKKMQKLQQQNERLRTERTRISLGAKHGTDIVDLIPETLSLKEQEALADKLAERFRTVPSQTEVATEEAPTVEPTPTEQRLAAVNSGSPAGSPAVQRISAREWMDLRAKSPTEADKLLHAGAVELTNEASPRNPI